MIHSNSSEVKRKRRRGAKKENKKLKRDNEKEEANTSINITEEKECSKQLLSSPQNDRKRKRKKSKAPKEGEEGYLSKTQLRNARKRRAKQRKQNAIATKKDNTQSRQTSSKSQITENTCIKVGVNEMDPSTKYLDNPLACPLVERAKDYFSKLDMSFQVYLGELTGWRTVSKLPVRSHYEGKNKKCTIGLFKPKSHKVVSVPDCVAHHPSINFIVSKLQAICNRLKIDSFNEEDGSGYFRYVCVNVDRSSEKLQLTIVWNSSPYEDDDIEENIGAQQLDSLTKELKLQEKTLKIHSLWVHYNAKWKHADGVFDFGTRETCSTLWKNIFGPQYIVEKINFPSVSNSVKLHFKPNVFRQANLDAFTNIMIAIRKYIISYNKQLGKLSSCLELYGGVGTLGLSLHDNFSSLISSDENPFNESCFMKSVLLLPHDTQKNIAYVPKNATDVVQYKGNLPKGNNAEILIVDPPRKGLDEYVLNALTNEKNVDNTCIFNRTKLLVYVSCGFDAFESDCNALLRSKKWKLDHAEGHVLFPGSNAIETLAFFRAIT